MSSKSNSWFNWAKNTVTPVKRYFTKLSVKVRTSQFHEFEKITKPLPETSVLDVGVTSDETLKDANLFERLYKWPGKITAVTIEDVDKIRKRYPGLRVIKIKPGQKLPFKSKRYDVAVSWATLEHVGNRESQQRFINEMLRVARKVFITTPDRAAPYEPHTGFWLLHWLPLNLFRGLCGVTNNEFWGREENLNPLWVSDLQKMKLNRNVKIIIYRMFGLFRSHIIITA